MENLGDAYWTTMAQVMPVVGLTLVIEARILAGRWELRTPWILKVIQASLWAAVLILLAFGESKAIRALRGVEPEYYWHSWCEFALTAGMGVVVLGPALDFLMRANASPLAWLFSLSLIRRARLGRLAWRIRRVNKGIEKLQQRRQRQIEKMGSNCSRFRDLAEGAEREVRLIDAGPEALKAAATGVIHGLRHVKDQAIESMEELEGDIATTRVEQEEGIAHLGRLQRQHEEMLQEARKLLREDEARVRPSLSRILSGNRPEQPVTSSGAAPPLPDSMGMHRRVAGRRSRRPKVNG